MECFFSLGLTGEGFWEKIVQDLEKFNFLAYFFVRIEIIAAYKRLKVRHQLQWLIQEVIQGCKSSNVQNLFC